MIDLAAAHHQVAEILREHGLTCSYCLTLHVWHHYHDEIDARIEYRIWVSVGNLLVKGETLAGVLGKLWEHFEPAPTPADPLDSLREVRVPGEASP